jgi:2-amino-4-hydroxy-6-hydroxymethyldihydropteridine diphosphokinase
VDGERVFVGLGSNLGGDESARCARLTRALREIGELPGTRVVAASSPWRSAPVDAEGPDFVNAVAELCTALEPGVLLRALHDIEVRHGRERPFRNAPRTLDLDLLLHGQRRVDTPVLVLPHPRLHLRAFVLEPLAEVAPDLALPGLGALAAWRARAADQRLERLPMGLLE